MDSRASFNALLPALANYAKCPLPTKHTARRLGYTGSKSTTSTRIKHPCTMSRAAGIDRCRISPFLFPALFSLSCLAATGLRTLWLKAQGSRLKAQGSRLKAQTPCLHPMAAFPVLRRHHPGLRYHTHETGASHPGRETLLRSDSIALQLSTPL
ncbi:hypothetical protein B0J13DRAFT_308035 [Dactylonectria estremocensis]|uniref:Uncharacterized protein n=1 Tax=Dactylonectria estremocensis TaxID=1079267 RepID=A0A9P9F0D9_9HYPO|nr:hypothetical protein B0J13DRAFT_308035 [Dactylonectria estremocensis]